jgi:hypothetical protein
MPIMREFKSVNAHTENSTDVFYFNNIFFLQ